jgi:hypothetical protein
VKRAATRERVRPTAELRGDVARGDWPALGPHLVTQLAVQEQILEHGELAASVGQLLVEHLERADDAVDLHRLRRREGLLGAAQRRHGAEIELAVLEARHLRQAPAERVEPHDVCIHLADAQRERVEVLLQRTPRGIDDGLLLRELFAPCGNLSLRIADPEETRRRNAAVEGSCADEKGRGDDPEPYATRGQAHVAQVSPVL